MNKELNADLTKELLEYQKTDRLATDLKKLFMEMIWHEIAKERYDIAPDNLRIMMEARAYEDCCRHSVHFNHEKSDDATAYVKTIIRSSFAYIIAKHGNFPKTRIEI